MRLVRVAHPGGVDWAEHLGDTVALLTGPPWLAGVRFNEIDVAQTTLLAPVLPSKIIGFARTYPKHAREFGNPVPTEPMMFLKPPSSLLSPGGAIVYPACSSRVDPEGEVGLVLGSRLHRASVAEAKAAVFGVTAVNDVTARDLRRKDGVFGRAKGFDTFCPVGPWIDTTLDPLNLSVHVEVNGIRRASGHTSEMVFNPYELLAWVSQVMTLKAGDLVATGTPDGVVPMDAGDHVAVFVEGMPALENHVISA
ncbi:MAG: DUF2437 domain-containing protein [Rhodobacterales bacterium]|nr:DUF2437 domain-containing protein [Rhodobacterales bacterium]